MDQILLLLTHGLYRKYLYVAAIWFLACGCSPLDRKKPGKPLSYADYAYILEELSIYAIPGSARQYNLERFEDLPTAHHLFGDIADFAPLWDDLFFVTGLLEGDPAGCVVAFPASCKGRSRPVLLSNGSIQNMRHLARTLGVSEEELMRQPWLPVQNNVSEEVLADLKSRLRVLQPGETAQEQSAGTGLGLHISH